MSYQGDIRLGDTIDIKFVTTAAATGAPTTLSGSPVISAYVGNGTTEITAGITLTVDFDSRTGLNNVRVVASSGNGFATATNVQLVITTGTVGGTSAVGYVVGEFSIEARSALMPTTAARTLDVSAGGEAGLDWANIGSPTTTVSFTGTTINLVTTTTTVTNQLTAAAIATGVWQTTTAGNFTVASSIGKCLYTGNVAPGGTNGLFIAGTNAATSITTALTANITGNLSGTVGTVTNLTNAPTAGDLTATMKTSVTTAATAATPALSAAGVTAVAAGVWNALTSGMTTVGSLGKKLSDWVVGTIDTYTGNTKQTGDNYTRLGAPVGASISADIAGISAGSGLDAAGVRAAIGLASANLDTQLGDLPTNAELTTALGTADDAVLAQVALVKAKTDQLIFTKANELDVNLQSVNGVTVNGDGAGTPMGV